MKKIAIKILVFSAIIFCAHMTPNTAQAQLPYGNYLDFWQHETPTVANSGEWLGVYLYPDGGESWSQWWYPSDYTVITQVMYSNGTTVNLQGSMHSSGVGAVIPPRPSYSNNYPMFIVTLIHKRNLHTPYTFSGYFYQK